MALLGPNLGDRSSDRGFQFLSFCDIMGSCSSYFALWTAASHWDSDLLLICRAKDVSISYCLERSFMFSLPTRIASGEVVDGG